MAVEKIIKHKADITRIKYTDDAIIVYGTDKVWVCEKDSEKDLGDQLIEFILKPKQRKGKSERR